jgi:ribosomal protein S16
MQGKILAYKKLEYSKHMKEKTTHRILCTNVWQEKNIFILENIFLYNPQRDRAINTSKKEIQKWWNKKLA